MKVYHGTISTEVNSLLKGIDVGKSQLWLDFGPGFYTNISEANAKQYAKRQARAFNSKNMKQTAAPCLFTYELDDTIFCNESIKCHIFFRQDDEWKNFVIANRIMQECYRPKVHNIDGRYDVVQGAIADGEKHVVTNYAYKVEQKLIQLEDIKPSDILPSGKFHTNYQISFHNNSVANNSLFLCQYDILQEDKHEEEVQS